MDTVTARDKELSIWAKKVSSQHPDILKHMREGTDTLAKVIAIRIMINAGVKEF
jgi:hypothetical protein